jgi:ribosomal protein S18 acetylase RimI-like enzyme
MVCREPIDGPPPEAGVQLRWLADVEDVDAMVELQDAAYRSLGMPAGVIREVVADRNRMLEPHLATVLALVDGTPVAGAQLHLSHGIGGVYFVGVVEQARGRGLAELVTRAVTNEGFARGAPFVGLQASPMGESLYRRMGYEEIYRYRSVTRFGAPATRA